MHQVLIRLFKMKKIISIRKENEYRNQTSNTFQRKQKYYLKLENAFNFINEFGYVFHTVDSVSYFLHKYGAFPTAFLGCLLMFWGGKDSEIRFQCNA